MKARKRVKNPAFCMQTLPLQMPPEAPRAPAGAQTPPPPRARKPARAPGTTRPRPAAPVDILAGEDAARRGGCRPRYDARNGCRRGKPRRPGSRRPGTIPGAGESVYRGRLFYTPPPGEFLRGVSSRRRRPPSPGRDARRGGCRPPPPPRKRCPFGHNGNECPRRPRPRFPDGNPRAIGRTPEALTAA